MYANRLLSTFRLSEGVMKVARVTYCVPKKKRDPVKGLILEYKNLNGLTESQLATAWGVSRSTCYTRLNKQHSDEWLTEAKELCKKLNIPIEEFREAVRY